MNYCGSQSITAYHPHKNCEKIGGGSTSHTMSKQLLHTHRSNVAIAGLNDRAFAIIRDGSNNDSSTSVLELMVATTTTKNGGDVDEKKKKKQHEGNNNPHEIQAVCSTQIESHIWLATSREDKTLSLYCIPSTTKLKEGEQRQQEQTAARGIYPYITYKLQNGQGVLLFAPFHPSRKSLVMLSFRETYPVMQLPSPCLLLPLLLLITPPSYPKQPPLDDCCWDIPPPYSLV